MQNAATTSAFRQLVVWQRAMEATKLVYGITRSLPKEEQFALANQMRRSAVSVPSNIAEGAKRGKKEFAQFLRIANGSAAELETQLLLAEDLYGSSVESPLSKLSEVQKMIESLLRKL